MKIKVAYLIITPSDPLREFVFLILTTLSLGYQREKASARELRKNLIKAQALTIVQSLYSSCVMRIACKERSHQPGQWFWSSRAGKTAFIWAVNNMLGTQMIHLGTSWYPCPTLIINGQVQRLKLEQGMVTIQEWGSGFLYQVRLTAV